MKNYPYSKMKKKRKKHSKNINYSKKWRNLKRKMNCWLSKCKKVMKDILKKRKLKINNVRSLSVKFNNCKLKSKKSPNLI